MENIQRTKEAYAVIKNESAREAYMYKLMIRCYLSQPFELILPGRQSKYL